MYNAFISYSHTADDKFAPALQNALQKFAKPWYKKRNLEVFRDESSLSASPHLWNNITSALDKSEYLILLASPASENSKWVNKEIEYWLEHKSIDNILIALTDGKLEWNDENKYFLNPDNNSLPPVLDNKFDSEPFYIDLRLSRTEEDLSLDNPIFKKEVLKLAAKLHGKPPNDLASEEVTVHRKMILLRNGVIGVLSLLLVGAIALGLFADSQRKVAVNQKNAAQNLLARNYWDKAQTKRTENNLTEALLFAAEGIFNSTDKDLSSNMIFDAEQFIPKYYLKDIIEPKGGIISINLSANDELILIACADSTVRIWNALTGRQFGPDMKHRGPINSAVFSPDGKQVLTTSDYKMVHIWKASTGKELMPELKQDAFVSKEAKAEYVINAIFSPDGKWVLTTNMDRNAMTWWETPYDDLERGKSFVRLWDASTGKQISLPMVIDGKVFTVVFSPDGKWILTAGNDSTARLWDAAIGKQIGPAMKHNNTVNSAVFSPDGKNILTASDDNTARIWDVPNCLQIGKELNHESDVISAVFSPDGKRVLSATWDDGSAHVWDIATGKQIGSGIKTQGSRLPTDLVSLDRGSLTSAFFDPDNKLILTAINYQNVRIWDALNGKQAGPELKHDKPVRALFNHDGKKIFTYNNQTFRVWEIIRDSQLISNMPCGSSENSIIRSLYGDLIIVGGADSTACVFNSASGKQIGPGIKLTYKLNAMHYNFFFSDGKMLVMPDERDSKLHFWEIASGKEIGPGIEGIDLEQPNINIELSKNGKLVLYTDQISPARIFDIASGKRFGKDMNHQGDVNSAFFSPDSKWVLTTGNQDFTANLWEASTGKRIGLFLMSSTSFSEEFDVFFSKAIFSPDGKRILTVCNNIARLWDVASGKQIGPSIQNIENSFGSAELSDDGKWLLTTSYSDDGTDNEENKFVRLWDLASGKQIGPGMMHRYLVHKAIFSPDGKRVLTSSDDSTSSFSYDPTSSNQSGLSYFNPSIYARLWEPKTGRQIGPVMIPSHSGYYDMCFIQNGKRILINTDSTYHILDISGDADFPGELFKIQANISTGWVYNPETDNLNIISRDQWYNLKEEYLKRAKEHYKTCKYPEINYWSRCYQEEVKNKGK